MNEYFEEYPPINLMLAQFFGVKKQSKVENKNNDMSNLLAQFGEYGRRT